MTNKTTQSATTTSMAVSASTTTVVSGMRATGKLHLGNYHGALKNWLKLQHEHRCYFFVADWHALTTHYEESEGIAVSALKVVSDWLAAGLDPKVCTIFVQSAVPEHAELHLLLSMITPVPWLERVPTYKDQQLQLKEKDLATYGFLGYPLLQSADILIYKAGLVPVGEDQISHLELVREVARRFNYLYGAGNTILPEPQALLTATAKFPGLDGRKMSKSYGNTIELTEDAATVTKKISTMPTDPARIKRTDPGDPAKCPVWPLHEIYSNAETKTWVMSGCKSASIGCLDCKRCLLDAIAVEQNPIRERAKEYAAKPQLVREIINNGAEAARTVARETLKEVKTAMGIAY